MICTSCCVSQKQSCATPLNFFSWALRCSTRSRGLVDPFLTTTHIAMLLTIDGTPSRVSDTSRPSDASAGGEGRLRLTKLKKLKKLTFVMSQREVIAH